MPVERYVAAVGPLVCTFEVCPGVSLYHRTRHAGAN